MPNAKRTEDVPHDRLTRLCNAMVEAMEAHPEFREEDKAIILLDNNDEGRGGMVVSNYDDEGEKEIAVRLLSHAEAVFEANGIPFRILPIQRGEG